MRFVPRQHVLSKRVAERRVNLFMRPLRGGLRLEYRRGRSAVSGGFMQLAKRQELLGTETAFAVSLAAAEWAAKGNRVFPFHLGDINLPTPANIQAVRQRSSLPPGTMEPEA